MSIAVILLPDRTGELAVCDVDCFLGAIAEDLSLDASIDRSAIDTLNPRHPHFSELLERVRIFAATGDASAYWGLK